MKIIPVIQAGISWKECAGTQPDTESETNKWVMPQHIQASCTKPLGCIFNLILISNCFFLLTYDL